MPLNKKKNVTSKCLILFSNERFVILENHLSQVQRTLAFIPIIYDKILVSMQGNQSTEIFSNHNKMKRKKLKETKNCDTEKGEHKSIVNYCEKKKWKNKKNEIK